LPQLDLTVLVEGQSRPTDLVERVHAAAARNGGVVTCTTSPSNARAMDRCI